jgi:vacuolar-type H+-ATPase subunit E/Vma4
LSTYGEALDQVVLELRRDNDRLRHQLEEMTESRETHRKDAEAKAAALEVKSAVLAALEGAARRYLDTIEELPAPSRSRKALEWALAETAKALGGGVQ